MIKDALRNEILSTRALDYRRNTIGLGALIAILIYFPQADWSNLNFLGIKLGGNNDSTRRSVFLFVWSVYLYHALFFLYYASRDFRAWWAEVAEPVSDVRRYFPEVGMYFGYPPSTKKHRRLTRSGWDGEQWNFTRGKGTCTWQPTPTDEKQTHSPDRYIVGLQDFRRVREKISWFAAIDAGVPIGIFAACLIGYAFSI